VIKIPFFLVIEVILTNKSPTVKVEEQSDHNLNEKTYFVIIPNTKMSKKYVFKPLFLCFNILFIALSVFGAQNNKKYVVFISDWGDNSFPQEIAGVMTKATRLKLTAVFSKNIQATEPLKQLINEGRIESAITLADEPILPMIYRTEISSPVAIRFSWPEDIWNMIASAGEKFYMDYSFRGRGLYLRSGIYSDKLNQKLHSMGIRWVNMNGLDGRSEPAYIKDDFLIIVNNNDKFKNAKECFDRIDLSTYSVTCVFFTGNNPLTPQFLYEFAQLLNNNETGSRNDIIEMATPLQIYNLQKTLGINADSYNISSDIKKWLKKPAMWYHLNEARKVIEEYRNSGSANMDVLEKLRGEIFGLYRYELIDSIQRNPSQKDEHVFQAGMSNIYKLSGLALPEWINEPIDLWTVVSESSDFSVKFGADNLEITNSYSNMTEARIRKLKVKLSKENVSYSVLLDSKTLHVPYRLDIYIDLNNKYRAGSTDLLEETNAFSEPDDAWEFALRMEGDKAFLYRSGRDKPKLIRQFYMEDANTVNIPKSILRGNPLKWGYQAVILTKSKDSVEWKIKDFLSPEDRQRQKILKKAVISLPSVRCIEK
jgi:hypothetical protein